MLSPCTFTPPAVESLEEIAHTQTDLLLDCLVAVYADLFQQPSFIRPQYEALYHHIKQSRINKHDFEHIRPLAQGQFGQVSVVRHKKNSQVYAMKTLNKAHVLSHHERTFYMEERNVLATAATNDSTLYQWIPKLHWAFQDENNLYLVMEYAGGGDLFSVLLRQNNECLTEQEARFYIAETIVAVDTLHQMGYIHRDIKPQNILIDHTGHVKIADFGSCISIQDAKNSPPKVAVGTCDYVAPEILQAQDGDTTYGTEVDWWSVGIVLYEALQVLPPFYSSESEKQTYFNIMLHETKLEFNDDLPISSECKDLIRKLLSKRDTRLGRNGVQEIQAHPFFAGIDWKNLRKTNPPFQPVLTSPDDTSNFSDASENEDQENPWESLPSNDIQERYTAFIGFSFSGFAHKENISTSHQQQNELLLQQLRAENKQLLDQIQREAEAQRENKNHATMMDDLHERIDVLVKENAQLKLIQQETLCTLDHEKNEREKTMQDLAKAQQNIDELTKLAKGKDHMKKEWMVQEEKLYKKLDDAQQQIQHLRYEMDRRKKVRDEEQLQQLEQKEQQATVLNDKDKQLKKYEQEMQDLKHQMADMKKQHDTQLQQLRDDNNAQLQKQLKEVSERNEHLEKQKQVFDAVEADYKNQIQEQQLRHDENNAAQLQMQRKMYEKEIQQLRDEKEKELQFLRAEKHRLERETQEQRDTSTRLESQLLRNEMNTIKHANSHQSIRDCNNDDTQKTTMTPSVDAFNKYKKNGVIIKNVEQRLFTDISASSAAVGASATGLLSVQKQKALPLLPMPVREGQLKITTCPSSPFLDYHVKLRDGIFCATRQNQPTSSWELDFRGSTVLVQEGTLEQEKQLGVTSSPSSTSALLILRIINKHQNASTLTNNNSIIKIDQQLAREQQYIQGAQKTLQARKKLLLSNTVIMSSTKQQRQIQLELEQAITTAQSKINQLLKERTLLIKGTHDVDKVDDSKSSLIKNHDLKSQKTAGETKCGFCQDVLWGPRVLACQKCQYQCHPQCPVDISCEEYQQLMQCTPYYLWAKDPTERNKWRRWLERSIQRYSDISREKTLSR